MSHVPNLHFDDVVVNLNLKVWKTLNPTFNILKVSGFCVFQSTRKISKIPFKVLDAPELQVHVFPAMSVLALCHIYGAY